MAISPDSKREIPDTAQLSGSNGVSMPGPMSEGYETGFDATGANPSGVTDFEGGIVGVQLPGGPSEEGWSYGEDFTGLAQRSDQPANLEDFGVFSDSGNLGLGDIANTGMHVVGTIGSNTQGVAPSDILSVFNALVPDGGGAGGGPVEGHDSLSGIPLGAGSGSLYDGD